MNLKGIDVSKYQGVIDWAKVGKSDVHFIMARASYGQTGRDKSFAANVAGAQACGMHVGAYHFSYAETVAQAVAEAKNFLTAVQGTKLTYPLVLDLEYNTNTAKSVGLWSDIAVAFLRALESAGYFGMLYTDKYSLESRFDAKKIAPFAVWVAQWADTCTCKSPYGMWQNSATGSISGIKGDVDTDISYVDYASIIQHAGLNHL